MNNYSKMTSLQLMDLEQQVQSEINKADIGNFEAPYLFRQYKNERVQVLGYIKREFAKRAIISISEELIQLKKRSASEIVDIDGDTAITIGSLVDASIGALEDYKKRFPKLYAKYAKKDNKADVESIDS